MLSAHKFHEELSSEAVGIVISEHFAQVRTRPLRSHLETLDYVK